MRTVFLFMMVSLDGYFEGENHDLSWHNVDNEFVQFAIEQLESVDTILFGRRTYEMMAEFWPSDDARREDPGTAKLMNETPKVVFSRTLRQANWQNSQLAEADVKTVVTELKDQPGKDIAVFGSNNLTVSLMEQGLLDEVRVMVNPVVLGKGTQLFTGLNRQVQLALTDNRTFKSGNVLLAYNIKQSK